MRTRSEIEMSSDYQLERAQTDLSTYPHARLGQLQLELLLDIREQNERIIALLERQPRLVFIPTTANIHDIISEIKQELDRDA